MSESSRPSLFTPAVLNGLQVQNRLVRSATGEGMAGPEGEVNDGHVRLYEALAKGGVGLIISGHTFVKANGKASKGMTGIHKDERIPEWRKLTEAVHAHGGKIVAQLNHAGRQTATELIGETPLAPSAVLNKANNVTPREATEPEIVELVKCYGDAARRAKAAGFDGVQLHAAHGYLISQFISPYTNKRGDAWGGSPERRMRFLLEAYKSVRQQVGVGYPVMIKLNAEDFIEGGLTVDMSCQIAQALERAGIDAIEISAGMLETASKIVRTNIHSPEQEAYFLPYAERFRRAVRVPLMLVGGIRSRAVMDRILSEGQADFVSLCRPFIREPHLALLLKAGAPKVECISCNQCSSSRRQGELRCMAGPMG